jgi:hypothetical protein
MNKDGICFSCELSHYLQMPFLRAFPSRDPFKYEQRPEGNVEFLGGKSPCPAQCFSRMLITYWHHRWALVCRIKICLM